MNESIKKESVSEKNLQSEKNIQLINDDESKNDGESGGADFKMVTFSLGGRDYGVDIMTVKEIARADKFTFVPNAGSFVKGVYNLRGDIIPIVDLRAFFHLPGGGGSDNMLILRIGGQVYGAIVDSIDRVVAAASIQPPHPIFGGINIRFISGVVEEQGRLFIILDMGRIFGGEVGNGEWGIGNGGEVGNGKWEIGNGKWEMGNGGVRESGIGVRESKERLNSDIDSRLPSFLLPISSTPEAEDPLRGNFVPDTSHFPLPQDTPLPDLLYLSGFTVSPVNRRWFEGRCGEWAAEKRGPPQNAEEAAAFLAPFASPCTGRFWDAEYAAAVEAALPEEGAGGGVLQVWNPGCGKGLETFSFACILKKKYPRRQIKIWANDSDIAAISSAPNQVFGKNEAPPYCRPFMVKGPGGWVFGEAVTDMILFEYHDVLNMNPYPELDIILARDVLSFLGAEEQERLLADFGEKLRPGGLVFAGANEELPEAAWKRVGQEPVACFLKREE
jgi:purine-binding chemotaxis protein CheW